MPRNKVQAWHAVVAHHIKGGWGHWLQWANRTKTRAALTLAPWALILLAVVAGLVGLAVCVEAVNAVRRTDPAHLAVLAYVISYTVLAVFFIRGNTMRHLARVAPLACLYAARTWARLDAAALTCALARTGLLTAGLLFVATSAAVTIDYGQSRFDETWCTIVDVARCRIPYTALHNLRTTFVRNRFLRQEFASSGTHATSSQPADTNNTAIVFDFTKTRTPPGTHIKHTPSGVILANGQGALGLYQGQFAAIVDLTASAPWPIRHVTLDTWAYVGNPEKIRGDWISMEISVDGGLNWTNLPLQLYAQRITPVHAGITVPVNGNRREVLVRLHLQTWPAWRGSFENSFLNAYGNHPRGQSGGCALLLDSLTLRIGSDSAQDQTAVPQE